MSLCNCTVHTESLRTIPPESVLNEMEVVQLRRFANAHALNSHGHTMNGYGIWRAKASKEDLIRSLGIHAGHEEVEMAKKVTVPIGDDGREAKIKELMSLLGGGISEGQVLEIIKKEIDKARANIMPLVIKPIDKPKVDVGVQHKKFPDLIKLVGAGEHVMIVGPAGGGKTEAALSVAKGLSREVEIVSFGPQTPQSELAGYRDATGVYRDTAVRRAYEQGKILICDEMDACNPGVLTFINSVLSNSTSGFPDGVAKKHDDFVVIACANTYGYGADMQYVGRAQLDAATLDRFSMLAWDYDEKFERTLAMAYNSEATDWVASVQMWRATMFKLKLRHVISPRASIKGAKLLKIGIPREQVEEMVVFKGLPKDTIKKIRGAE